MTSIVLPGAEDRLLPRRVEVETIVAVVAVPLTFTSINLPMAHLTSGLVIVAVLGPVWLGVLSRFVGALLVTGLCLVAGTAGVVLAVNASSVSEIDKGAAVDTMLQLVTFVGTMGVVLWARTLMRSPQVALLAGLGLLASVSTSSPLYASNPWRFGFSIPVTVIVLALAWWIGSRQLQLTCLMVLALLSAVNDSRSNFGMLILAAILLLIRPRDRGDAQRLEGNRRSWAPVALAIAAVSWAVFQGAQTLILDGYLGQTTQQRSEAQVSASGSLLLGGRPELAATAALMRSHPTGFGVGVVPSLDQINTAKAGMASINYDPNNGYVERYMLGTRFELHSVFGDLWAAFGLAGLLVAITVVVLCVRGAAISLRTGQAASALTLYLAVRSLWGVAFSPFESASTLIALFLGLILMERAQAPRVDRDSLARTAR